MISWVIAALFFTGCCTVPLEDTETTAETIKDSTFSVHLIDVGQADAALVECDGHYMLIDGGNKADLSKIYSVLRSQAVSKLDMIVRISVNILEQEKLSLVWDMIRVETVTRNVRVPPLLCKMPDICTSTRTDIGHLNF